MRHILLELLRAIDTDTLTQWIILFPIVCWGLNQIRKIFFVPLESILFKNWWIIPPVIAMMFVSHNWGLYFGMITNFSIVTVVQTARFIYSPFTKRRRASSSST